MELRADEKKSFFEILFAARMGKLVRFAGPVSTRSADRAVLDFYVESFGDLFSALFAVLTAEKHAWKICRKFVENSAEFFIRSNVIRELSCEPAMFQIGL